MNPNNFSDSRKPRRGRSPRLGWERTKSLLLTVLVLTSLVLTWSLWSYQFLPESSKDHRADYIEVAIVPEGDVDSVSEVVQPEKVLFYTDDKVYGLLEQPDVEKVYNRILTAEISDFTKWNAKLNKKRFEERPIVEIIFPAPVSPSLFKQSLVTVENEDGGLNAVDPRFQRIRLYAFGKENPDMLAVFTDDQGNPLATATAAGLNLSRLVDSVEREWRLFTKVELTPGNILYLPEGRTDLPVLQYNYQLVAKDNFIEAMFLNQEVYRQGDSYSDGINLLEFDLWNDAIVHFTDFAVGGERKSVLTGEPVVQSFERINSNKGWTDSYRYSQLSSIAKKEEGRPEVIFRLLIGAEGTEKIYPVFSPLQQYYYHPYQDAAAIYLSWENEEIYEFARTRINLEQMVLERPTEPLAGGDEFYERLKQTPGVSQKLIQDLQLGYKMEFPPDANYVTFVPKWFILYDGQWHTIEDFLGDPSEQGVELP